MLGIEGMKVFAFLVGLVFGGAAVAGWLLARLRAERFEKNHYQTQTEQLSAEFNRVDTAHRTAQTDLARALALVEEKDRHIDTQLAQWRESLADNKKMHDTLNALSQKAAQHETQINAERRSNEEKLALLTSAREQLSLQFKELAQTILEEKTQKFTTHNQDTLHQLLHPLREQISAFNLSLQSKHEQDIAQQATLKAELEQLKTLNHHLSQEAHSLTQALKGQKKMQGNWGEMILENVLEQSGLRSGVEYQREQSVNTAEGRRRPDVIINLPQGRHLVIDAKVSLNAYTDFVNAETEVERERALQAHVGAIRARMAELSERQYFDLPNINSPEVVFLFLPMESAFVEAIRAEPRLFDYAMKHNLLLATPTTLLTSLNIVRQLWRFEEQNQHSKELADKASAIYKKLLGFVDSFQDIGKHLDKSQGAYQKAMGQLSLGPGNLIKQASEFERLGVSVVQRLPEELVDRARLELPIIVAPGHDKHN